MSSPPNPDELNDLSTGLTDLPVLRVRASVGSARSSDGWSMAEGSEGTQENHEIECHDDFVQLSIRDMTSSATLPRRASTGPMESVGRRVAEKNRRQKWRNQNAVGMPRPHSDGATSALESALDLQDTKILGRTSHKDAFSSIRRKLSSGPKDANDSSGIKSRLGSAISSMLHLTPHTSFNEFDDELSEYENDSFVNREDHDQDDSATEYGNEPSVYANDSFVDRVDSEDDVFEDDEQSAYTEDDMRDMVSTENALSMGADNTFSPFGVSDPRASSISPAFPTRQFPKQILTTANSAGRKDSNKMDTNISVPHRSSPESHVHANQTGRKPFAVPSLKSRVIPTQAPYSPPPADVSGNSGPSAGDVEHSHPTGTKLHHADPEGGLLHSPSPHFSISTWDISEDFKDENSKSDSCVATLNQSRCRRILVFSIIALLLSLIFGGAIALFIFIPRGDDDREHEVQVTVQAKPPTADESGDANVGASIATQTLEPSIAQSPSPMPVLAPAHQPQIAILAANFNNGSTSLPSTTSIVDYIPLHHPLPQDENAGWLLVGDHIRRSRTERMHIPIEASVVISYDGIVLASASASVVEVFMLGQDGWSLIGNLTAEGQIVSLGISHDGTTVGYGSLMADSSCLIQIYRNTQDGGWNQMGQDLNEILGFRHSLSMNMDGNVVALGSPLEEEGSGKACVYDYDETLQTWYQRGESIVGSTFYEYIGAVSLSSDGQTLAVGAPGASERGVNSGRAQVYRYNGNSWVQIGQSLFGLVKLKQFGFSVALNKDGSRLAVGAPFAESKVDEKGHIFVYDLSSSNEWTDVGVLGLVDSSSDEAGRSVQLSESGKTLVFTAPGVSTVHVRQQVDGIWKPYGEFSGSFVSVANDGSVVAVCDVDDNESTTSFVRVLARREAVE